VTPEHFIANWTHNDLTERGGAQPYIEDLCRLIGIDPPRSSKDFCYEKDLEKAKGGKGWADVWKRNHFGWENKKPGRNLADALVQLRNYAPSLDHPPLLVVCDRERIEIHTAFPGYPDVPITILLSDIGRPENLQTLRWIFTDPDKLRPLRSNSAITKEAAETFAELAQTLRGRGNDAQQVAHFLIQSLFCMFAEDEGILHEGQTENSAIFTRILKSAGRDPARAKDKIGQLFSAMQRDKGQYGDDYIAWFNGGLFKTIDIPDLTGEHLAILHKAAAELDWRAIDPTIFGTLFERGLDPSARAPLGAHYTDAATIRKLIDPLIVRPLAAEWAAARPIIAKGSKFKKGSAGYRNAAAAYHGYLERLKNFRVLDPACGSGNFLYLALRALKDLEQRAQNEAEALGLSRQVSIETGPSNILGLEINEYAAELARVTVWIGDIQWSRENGREIARRPILRSLDGIEHRDALLTETHGEAQWPVADVIVGNPPFLGDKVMRGELGDDYVDHLRKCFAGRVPGGADLVTYWFEKARAQIEAGKLTAAGLVSTNSIRGGANRKVLDRIVASTRIFEAWSDEPWVNDGAAVRVSLIGFGLKHPEGQENRLDGKDVTCIHADLTAGEGIDLAREPLAKLKT